MSWPLVELEELAIDKKGSFVDGPFGSNLKASEYIDEGIPIIRLQNIKPNKYITKSIKYISEKKAQELNRHNYKAGDIVIAKLGAPTAQTCIIPKNAPDGIIVADVVRMRVDSNKASKHYISYFLNSQNSKLQILQNTKGTTRQRINLTAIRKLKIPLPPLDIQKKIAAVLDKADELRQKRKQAIAKLDELLQSVFLDMFGDPVTNPKGWPVKKLGEVCDLVNGRAFKPTDWSESGMPIIRIQNLKNTNAKYNYFQGSFDDKLLVEKGDLLISWAGQLVSFGVFIWNDKNGVLNQHIFKVGKKIEISTIVLKHILAYIIEHSKSQFHGVDMKHITKKDLVSKSMIIPSYDVQLKFEKMYITLLENQEYAQVQKDNSNFLFNSLLQKAFKGELKLK